MYNRYNNFKNIITEENIRKFSEYSLNREAYENILEMLSGIGLIATLAELDRVKDMYDIDILDVITIIATRYAKVIPKSSGAALGSYSFNVIQIDDRLDKSEQIATIIHELSHHLFAEIYEQTMMIMLGCDKTDAIESFVGFALNQREMRLINEYCASTVEGRFIPFGYQDYGSFNNLLMSQFNPITEREMVLFCLTVGNTIAQDIIRILEILIPQVFREEIKMQYRRDFRRPQSDGILLETNQTIPEDLKYAFINTSIAIAMKTASSGEFDEMLNAFETVFKEVNRI